MFILACRQGDCFFKHMHSNFNVVGESNNTSITYQAESLAFADPSMTSIFFSATLGILIGCLLTAVWKKTNGYGLKGYTSKLSENTQTNNKSLSSQMIHSVSRQAHTSIGTWPSKKSHYSHYRNTSNLMQCDVLNVINEEIKCIGPKHKQVSLLHKNSVTCCPISPINSTWFKSVIGELLNNAIKHNWIGKKLKIEITTSVEANYFIVCIADNGMGLSNKITSKLKALNMTKEALSSSLFTNTESTNLASIKVGLYQVKGSLEVISARQFLTKVILKIPLLKHKQKQSDERQEIPSIPFESAVQSEGFAILVLSQQDESEFGNLLFLKKHFNLYWANSIEAGARAAMLQKPDCVLFDTDSIEARSALSLYEWQNKGQMFAELPIILLEKYAGNYANLNGLSSGISACITKCSETKDIALSIEKAIWEKERVVEQVSEGIANYHLRMVSANNINNQEDIKFLERFALMIQENYTNERFNRPDAAKQILMTEKTLSRKLHHHYKLGFTEILRQFRLQQAKKLLINGEQVTTTAYDTGFNSPSYFSKCFRDEFGFAPSQLTKQRSST